MKERNLPRKCKHCEKKVSLQFALDNWKKISQKDWCYEDCHAKIPKRDIKFPAVTHLLAYMAFM